VKNEVSNHEVKCWYLRGLLVKYREKVKQYYPETYEETKNQAIKIKKHKKSNEFDLKKANVIGEESTYQIDSNVDNLASTFSELKICQVSQASQDEKGTKRIDKLEYTINELIKLIKNIANNKSQSNPNQQNWPSQNQP
ncbi:34405_t:CDS:1, partial [Racocetra persica]